MAGAVRRGETVAVFGDYDVDGACSAAVMTLLLRGLGCTVLTHVPDRLTEGYGPNLPALQALAADGASLIVCVDCGTAAGAVLAGMAGRADIVVLDHHKSEGPPPDVVATVNASAVGNGALNEGEDTRGEIWLPLWGNPARLSELRRSVP